MVNLSLSDNRIELISYDQEDLISSLIKEVELFRKQPGLKTSLCKGCGACCAEDIPLLGIDLIRMPGFLSMTREDFIKNYVYFPNSGKLDIGKRSKAIETLSSQMGIAIQEAVYLYEFNSQVNLLLRKKDDGSCIFLHEGICRIYNKRPICCAFYNCIFGHTIEMIYDQLVCQGTWHAYDLMGLIPASEIKHNPFAGNDLYDDVKIGDLDIQLEQSLAEKLFFFY